MSKITFAGHASGTGTLTFAAPNTNTNQTLTLPDLTGTLALTSQALSAASTTEAQAGTSNTVAITPLRMREGFNASGSAPVYACRAWVNFNGTGTVAIRASGNVSSITDNGTGDYTVNFTTAMPDANYSCVMMAGHKGIMWGLPVFAGLSGHGNTDSHATNRVRVIAQAPSDNANDTAMINVAIFR